MVRWQNDAGQRKEGKLDQVHRDDVKLTETALTRWCKSRHHSEVTSSSQVDPDGALQPERLHFSFAEPLSSKEGIMLQDPVAIAACLWALAVIITKLMACLN